MKVHKVNTVNFNQVSKERISPEKLQREYDFTMAQKILINLRNAGLISNVEFNKITDLNGEKFSPFLGRIMPKILDKQAV